MLYPGRLECISHVKGNVAMWDQSRMRLLVVEDEVDVRNLIADLLAGSAYTFTICASYAAAVEFASSPGARIDLLLSDIILPPFHGRDLANRLVGMHTDLKVLFMSGYPIKLLKQHSLLPLEAEFLPKPFTKAQLIEALAALAGKAKPWVQAATGHPL